MKMRKKYPSIATILLVIISLVSLLGCKKSHNSSINDSNGTSQDEEFHFKIESVKLTETISNQEVSNIPKLIDVTGKNNLIVSKINKAILDRFGINSYDHREITEFRWFDVDFKSEISNDILFIKFSGEFIAAHSNSVDERMFFDLSNGDMLNDENIQFSALFTLDGYFDFLNKYWLTGVRKVFNEAVVCSEIEPYCSVYDINSYEKEGENLVIHLEDMDCYPRFAQMCAPTYSTTVKLSQLAPYLDPLGKNLLLGHNIEAQSEIEKFKTVKQLQSDILENIFLFGKIDDEHAFSMGLNLAKDGYISGFYFYDNQQQKISLSGNYKNGEITLEEMKNQKVTGRFYLELSSDFDKDDLYISFPKGKNHYLSGRWINANKDKSLKVQFTVGKTNF